MNVIKVENLSKRFILRHDRTRSIADTFTKMFSRNEKEEFWALKDINFTVKKGEAVGIIGHNGAGKSTLLKLLTKIMAPTHGNIKTRGRVSALIEVGAGFHPEMTGRENIFLNGSILGMKKSEISKKLDSIIEFAGLEQFIDTPIKRYSSGMYARLGFSVAAHVEPDILLVDEVLSVGDEKFQVKCQQHMSNLMNSGVTVLFVSHNLPALMALCKRSILLNRGEIVGEGDSPDMVRQFRKLQQMTNSQDSKHDDNRGIYIKKLTIKNSNNEEIEAIDALEPLIIEAEIQANEPLDKTNFGFEIDRSDGVRCYAQTSAMDDFLPELKIGLNKVQLKIDELALVDGIYTINFGIMDEKEVIHFHTIIRGAYFTVRTDKLYRGTTFLRHNWNMVE
ncbi:MAG: ABC transporter ATP-binding protein [Armatimonadota bacterium]